ncbi:c6 zinc finger domain-containing protein [Fusarium mundagurra]|uniref:C6 zinc finger domain-containing protein n=1 Tax=Fusarium mundagurra TaxID=1567541 RepID=A0A8H6CX55_9HYPO|nr:c6 zinc finger domain-containing protein [Fusarium mundagurra]
MSENEPPKEDEALIQSTASILEFLAWGKRKSLGNEALLSPEVTVSREPKESEYTRDVPDGLEESGNTLNILQLLLPSPKQVWQLVMYHEASLLWYHNSYHAPTFREQLRSFYNNHSGSIIESHYSIRVVNLQWIALLFSVLTGTMTCAPYSVTSAWGFQEVERELLCKKWFHAVISSLNKAEYTAKQSILSVQAISTLTISAHILGNSNMHAVHIAAAVRIAQGLGLHRLTDDSPVKDPIEKETGRRVWAQLCSQDWFSTSFYETYLINPIYSSSELPTNCHDNELVSYPDSIPTIVSYSRFLTRIASLMPSLQDELIACNTGYTRYEKVLKWDKRLRDLVTTELPYCLSKSTLSTDWPDYIPWARRALAITSAHKIIMIHRSFLAESFVNPTFEFTRGTCIAASKTIIKEYKAALQEAGPIIWIHQAFSIAAAITLTLDILHRDNMEPEYVEHKKLIQNVADILQDVKGMIASRGTKLLSALLKEVGKHENEISDTSTVNTQSNKRRRLGSTHCVVSEKTQRRIGFNVNAFVARFCNELGETSKGSKSHQFSDQECQEALQAESLLALRVPGFFEDLDANQLNYQSFGLNGATDFENLLYLAQQDIM